MLNRDFKEFIASLNESEVRYLVVGGYALAFHGHPRYTKDLDVWIWSDSSNAERVVAALAAFGFESLGLSADDFREPDQVIQLGYPPNRIDLLTSIAGVSFAESYPSRVTVDIGGVPVDFIDLANFKRNKAAAGRLQDLADLEELEGLDPSNS